MDTTPTQESRLSLACFLFYLIVHLYDVFRCRAFHILYWQIQDARYHTIIKRKSMFNRWDFINSPYNKFGLSMWTADVLKSGRFILLTIATNTTKKDAEFISSGQELHSSWNSNKIIVLSSFLLNAVLRIRRLPVTRKSVSSQLKAYRYGIHLVQLLQGYSRPSAFQSCYTNSNSI